MRSLGRILIALVLAAALVFGITYYDAIKVYSNIQEEVLASNKLQYNSLKESVFVLSADDSVKEHFDNKELDDYMIDKTKMALSDLLLLQGVKEGNQAYYDAYRLIDSRLGVVIEDTWQYVWEESDKLIKKVDSEVKSESKKANTTEEDKGKAED